MWFWALWLACGAPTSTTSASECDPAPRVPGEIRARRIACTDEILPSGEARLGDWMLENARIRLAIRDATVSLTQLTGTGGTLIDAAHPTGTDALVELIPSINSRWLQTGEVSAWQTDEAAGITVDGLLPDGTAAQVGYTLGVDSSELVLEGMDAITVVPMTNSVRVDEILETPVDGGWMLFAPDGEVNDLGGWIEWRSPESLHVGVRDDVYASRWPDAQWIAGTSDAEWVVGLTQDRTTMRLPVADGAFSGWVPTQADALQGTASGTQPSDAKPPRDGVDLPIGDSGHITLWVVDESGDPMPATLNWNGRDYSWLPGDGAIGVGPGLGSGWVSAGFAYDTVQIPQQEIAGKVAIEVQLHRQLGEGLLARLDVVGAPDPTERRSSERILRAQAAAGIQWAVLVAKDEIPRVSLDEDTAMWISAQSGSISGGNFGAPMTWPWSTDTDSPAHGATPWHLMGPLDMLDAMTKAGSRRAVIDANWVSAAGPALDWQLQPEAFRLNSLDDLPAFISLLQQWVPLAPVGPWTWVEGITPEEASTTEAVRGILAGRTTATTGPRLELTVDGTGAGELLPESIFPAKRIRLRVSAAAQWAPTHAAIITEQGEIGRWEITKPAPELLDVAMTCIEPDWVLAIAWSEDAPELWAVSAPVWVGRP